MNKEILLCDTTYIPSYEDYKEWCYACGKEHCEEGSRDYLDFVEVSQRKEIDDLMENLNSSAINFRYYWVVTESLVLWCGRRDIDKHMTNSLSDAIRLCVNHADDTIIKKRGSVIYVTALHHGGRNYFEIRALSEKGLDRLERNGDISINNRQNIVTVPKYLF